MTESIAVSSGKGGVGKTTIAVNVALTLAKNGNKTLLLDADLGMANAHLVLGVNPEKSLDDFINKKVPISKISSLEVTFNNCKIFATIKGLNI